VQVGGFWMVAFGRKVVDATKVQPYGL